MLLRKIASTLARGSLIMTIVIFLGIAYYINQYGPIPITFLREYSPVEKLSYPGAILAGVFVGYPLGQALGGMLRKRRWRRWSAMTALALWVVGISILWGWHASAAAIPSIILTFIFTAIMLRELYAGSIRKTLSHHIHMTFGALRGFQIVSKGKMIVPSGQDLVLGPRLLIIRPGNAVLTIANNKQKIYGPGVHETIEFEYIDQIFDLGEQQHSWRIRNILTKERLPLNGKIAITYRLDIDRDQANGDEEFASKEAEKVRRIVRELPDWKTAAIDVVKQMLRDDINSMAIDALTRVHNHTRMADQLRKKVNRIFVRENWPIVIDSVVLTDLQLGNEVSRAVSANWIEEQRAEAWQSVLNTIARGYTNAVNLGMTEDQLKSEVLRYTLEQISKDPTTTILFNRELNEMMAALRA